MAEGQKAADETKGVFKGLGAMGEDLRKNINSFADNLVSDKTTSNTGTHGAYDEKRDVANANRDIHNGSASTGLMGSNSTGTGTSSTTTGTSGDVHPDAKKLGGKIESALDPDKHKTT
ncbi:hypothetical protein LTR85_000131 [Meristemomyces frigidus]|nr:hypothetical protein LTR85_000131 [Meristemomyces frigidus]